MPGVSYITWWFAAVHTDVRRSRPEMGSHTRSMTDAEWPDPSALQVGLGCMRLWTEDRERSSDGAPEAAIAAAIDSGITVYDTARTYDGPGGEVGGNERALGRLLRSHSAGRGIRIVTKGGMRREGTAWIPDGRARTVLSDCEASLVALDGIPISVYLLHAPDRSRPWRTSLRALARVLDDGLVAHVGLSNVSRVELEEAATIVPVTAVEIALSPFDDSRLRDGTLALCADRGITVIAYSPLGGPRRAKSLERNATLRAVAARRATTVAEVALAWLLDLGPNVVVIPGARRPSTVRSAAGVAAWHLGEVERETLRNAFGGPRAAHVEPAPGQSAGDVVLVMGIPGAGKSRIAEDYVKRGYLRLNRDQRGGSMRDLCAALDDALGLGTRNVVLDNTWLTRAIRSRAIEVAARHGVAIRCVWLEIALVDAQRNLVERVLERRDSLPTPEEVRLFNGRDGMLSPTAQMRTLRELEPPSAGEGFASVEAVPFARAPSPPGKAPGVFVAASVTAAADVERVLVAGRSTNPHLVFDWHPDGDTRPLERAVERVRALVASTVDAALCPHPAGPPVCWCRPHLLGLVLQFTRGRDIDPSQSVLIGTTATHRSMAATLGCRYIAV